MFYTKNDLRKAVYNGHTPALKNTMMKLKNGHFYRLTMKRKSELPFSNHYQNVHEKIDQLTTLVRKMQGLRKHSFLAKEVCSV